MSGGGGQSRPGPTNTTVQTNTLPAFMEGPLKTAANAAENTFKSGVGSTPYPGATYVPPGQDEMAGMERIRSLSQNNPFMQPMTSQFTGLLNNQGISGDHRSSLAPAQAIARGDIRINTGGAFGNLANQFGRTSASEANLGRMAAGQASNSLSYLHNPAFQRLYGNMDDPLASRHLAGAARGDYLGPDGNPHFNQALDDASTRTMQGVNAQMASMGRLGSDAHAGVGSREVGELQTRARADQHNLERQLQQSAAAQMDQARLAQGGLLSGILGQQAGLTAQDFANRRQAAGQMDQARMARLQGQQNAIQGQTQVQGANIANQGQTALSLGDQYAGGRDAMLRGMALGPAMNQMRYSDARNLIDVGAAQRGELQDELQSNIERFQGEQMQPWGQIGLLTSALQGFPNMGTVRSESTGTVPRGSRISGLLGGGLAGAGVGSSFGPWGAGIGGLLGGLGGAFM